MTGYIVFGLLFVLLIVFTVMTVKNWHWTNIVVLALTYIAGVAAIYSAGWAMKLRTQAILELKRSTEALERAERELNEVRYGGGDALTYSPTSLYGVQEALKLQMTGRGRVWMNGAVAEAGPNRKFTFPVARNAGDPQVGMLNQVLVFAFLDADFNGFPYPARFVGTFRVANEAPDSLELVPELVLNSELMQSPGTWTLFEKMPSDQHDIFSQNKPDGSGKMTISEFRTLLETEFLPPQNVGLAADSAEYERFIDQIAFDGRSLGEIETWIEENAAIRKNQRFSPLPTEVFVRFKFNKKSNRQYKVDGIGNLESDGPYTLLGEAIDPALHLGKEVAFNPDDEILIDLPTATGYQRSDQTAIQPFSQLEDVTEVDRIYSRKLVNFPAMFTDLRRQSVDLAFRTEEVRKQNEVQAKTLADAEAQITLRDDVTTKMQADNENLKKDVAAISELLKVRTAEIESMQQEIADLERKISALRARRDGGPVPVPVP